MTQQQYYYGYYPETVLGLGLGFDPTNVQQPKTPAIIMTPRLLDGSGALSTQFVYTLVRTTTQMKETLGLDLRVDASFLVFKGSTTFSFNQNVTQDASSLTVVVSGITEFSRRGLDPASIALTPAAQAMLVRPKQFVESFGSHYGLIERRGAAVHAILTVSQVSESARVAINTSMAASGGWGPLSASARAAFQRELVGASSQGRLECQVVATGGAGFAGLADMVRTLSAQSDSLQTVTDSLASYLRQFNESNAAPLGYHVGSFVGLGLDPSAINLWSETKVRRLLAIVDRYREVTASLDNLNGILSGVDPRWRLLPAGGRAALQRTIGKLEDYLDRLASTHESFRLDTSAMSVAVPEPDEPLEYVLPWPPPDPVVAWRVKRDEVLLEPEDSWEAITTTHANMDPSLSQVLLGVDGYYFHRINIFFEDAAHMLKSASYPSDQTSIVLGESDLPFATYIRRMYAEGRQRGTGVFYLEITDVFNRRLRFPLASASWSKYTGPASDGHEFGLRIDSFQLVAGASNLSRAGLMVRSDNIGLVTLLALDRAGPPTAGTGARVIAACEATFEANKSDCSRFVKAVARAVGVQLDAGLDADGILAYLARTPAWRRLSDGREAATEAETGHLVVGGMTGSDLGDEHGHVVVVVAGPLNRDKYPMAYWGKLHGVGLRAMTMNWAFTADVLDDIEYFSTALREG